MTVVDTSVWIDYFNGIITAETDLLDQLLGQQTLIIGDLILTEVLQGFRRQRHFEQAQQLLQRFPVVTMLGSVLAIRSNLASGKAPTRRKSLLEVAGTPSGAC